MGQKREQQQTNKYIRIEINVHMYKRLTLDEAFGISGN